MSMSKGKPLTLSEREKIETWLRMKKKKIWIAIKLDRDKEKQKKEIRETICHITPPVLNILSSEDLKKLTSEN